MAKQKDMTQEQERILRRDGLVPGEWIVLQDYPYTMLIRNMVTGEYRTITKKTPPS